MKRIISLAVIVILSLGMVSCDKEDWKEKTAEGVAKFVTPNIAAALTCTGNDAIKEDIKIQIQKIKWLKPNQALAMEKGLLKSIAPIQKGIAGQLCVLTVVSVLPSLINYGTKEIPADWKCTANLAQKTAIDLAKEGCKYLP